MASKLEDRVLTHRGRQHFRRTYSRVEVRYSLAVLFGLVGILAWVIWKGAHPDPTLFESPLELDPAAAAGAAAIVVDRGPLPEGLAPEGFAEEKLGVFDATNLYEKINGREGYFKSFGFQKLWAETLVAAEDPARVVELEVYDLGSPDNAMGAFSGELPEGAEAREVAGGLAFQARNALLMTRGKHFVRAIGADEGPQVKAALAALETTFVQELAGGEKPWSHTLFQEVGAAAGEISYYSENAFSFGFADQIHAARLPDGSTEVFVHASADAAAAEALAARFAEGFLQYGEAEDEGPFVTDRYLGEVSGAVSEGAWVLGVRTAPDRAAAEASLAKLRAALLSLPPETHAKALVAGEESR